jgi:hypothetical protein
MTASTAGASLGGMIATLATGPRCLRRPRLAETVVSVTIVGADGTIARTAHGLQPGSGRSRSARLVTGSWGTRAIIVEAEIESDSATRNAAGSYGSPAPRRPPTSSSPDSVPDAVVIERPPGSPAATVALCEGETDEVEAEVGHLVDRFPGDPVWANRNGGGAERDWPRPSECPWHRSFIPRLIDAVDRLETTIGYPLQLRGSATGSFELGIGAPESEPGMATRVVLEHLRSFGLHFIAARLIHAPAPVWDEVDAWGPQPGRSGWKSSRRSSIRAGCWPRAAESAGSRLYFTSSTGHSASRMTCCALEPEQQLHHGRAALRAHDDERGVVLVGEAEDLLGGSGPERWTAYSSPASARAAPNLVHSARGDVDGAVVVSVPNTTACTAAFSRRAAAIASSTHLVRGIRTQGQDHGRSAESMPGEAVTCRDGAGKRRCGVE